MAKDPNCNKIRVTATSSGSGVVTRVAVTFEDILRYLLVFSPRDDKINTTHVCVLNVKLQ